MKRVTTSVWEDDKGVLFKTEKKAALSDLTNELMLILKKANIRGWTDDEWKCDIFSLYITNTLEKEPQLLRDLIDYAKKVLDRVEEG